MLTANYRIVPYLSIHLFMCNYDINSINVNNGSYWQPLRK